MINGVLWERDAVEILGADRVITVGEVKRVWSQDQLLEGAVVSYREQTLVACAEANKGNQESWWLVYFLGFSFWEQYLRMGINPDQPPFFTSLPFSFQIAPDKNDPTDWRFQEHKSGFWLINLKPIALNSFWETEDIQRAVGPGRVHADESMVSEAFFSIFLAKHKVVLARSDKSLYHLGKSRTSNGNRLWLGEADSGGGIVLGEHEGAYKKYYGACAVKSHDV